MNLAGGIFAAITATLEDMHDVAVEGQAPDVSRGEGLALLRALSRRAAKLGHLIADAKVALR